MGEVWDMDALNALVLVFVAGTTMLVISINLAVYLMKRFPTKSRLRYQRV